MGPSCALRVAWGAVTSSLQWAIGSWPLALGSRGGRGLAAQETMASRAMASRSTLVSRLGPSVGAAGTGRAAVAAVPCRAGRSGWSATLCAFLLQFLCERRIWLPGCDQLLSRVNVRRRVLSSPGVNLCCMSSLASTIPRRSAAAERCRSGTGSGEGRMGSVFGGRRSATTVSLSSVV